MRKRIDPPTPLLFKHPGPPKICSLVLSRQTGRRCHEATYGLQHVIDELCIQVLAEVRPPLVDNYDIALCSFTSPMDVLRFVQAFEHKPPHARIVVGGQGAYPFLAYRHLVDRVMFGRAEGAVDDIVLACAPPALRVPLRKRPRRYPEIRHPSGTAPASRGNQRGVRRCVRILSIPGHEAQADWI